MIRRSNETLSSWTVRRFCSRSCARSGPQSSLRGERSVIIDPKICNNCGREFTRPSGMAPKRWNRRVTCNRSCRPQRAAYDMVCTACTRPIIKTAPNRRFCADCRVERRRATDRERQRTIRSTPEYRLKYRAYSLGRNYGITIDQFDVILARQGGVCAICGSPDPRWTKAWHVDHDHRSGFIRGILCQGCNLLVGMSRDRADVLRQAADYLEVKLQDPYLTAALMVAQ